ncbi:MAG: porin family protein [Legionellaceae bacterium]|nr:porin family protein [Legionellaceae bacterium]
MKHRLLISAGLLSLLTNQAMAGSMGKVKDWNWVGTVSAGAFWAEAGDSQSILLSPGIEKMYAARRSTNVLAAGELFLGIQKVLSTEWLGQFGFATAATGYADLQGQIWDDADSQFNNFNYQYRVRNTRVSLKGKLIADKGFWAMPWVSASVGVGFNRANGFSNTPLIAEAVTNPRFSDNTQTAFTYTVGLGLQKAINKHWQTGVGYEFADWGKSTLGRAPGQTLNSGPSVSNIYTNGVLLNITYIA